MTVASSLGRVAVLMGGNAAEREISLQSGMAVYQSLLRSGVDAFSVDVGNDLLGDVHTLDCDCVFNIMHGRGGEDGVLQAILECRGLPYTGSGVLASALSMDKLRTKLCWQGAGLITPKWYLLQTTKDVAHCAEILDFPVIVKPAQEGSSLGMSRADNEEELLAAWHLAAKYGCDVYAESWVQGSEYTVAILDGKALPIIRLQTPNVFYDFDAKYRANTTQYHCPSGLSVDKEDALSKLAVQACDVLGVTGWARVDVFIDQTGVFQLIEVNTVPGMTSHSLVPMAAKVGGLNFDQLVLAILSTCHND